MEKSLSGIKVIQLATFVAAAATGRYLADHGADVIIVEAKQGGDAPVGAAVVAGSEEAELEKAIGLGGRLE